MTLADLALALNAAVDVAGPGDRQKVLRRVAPPRSAGPDALTFVSDRRYLLHLSNTAAGAVLLPRGVSVPDGRPVGLSVLFVEDAYRAFARAAQWLQPPPPRPTVGIHTTAIIDGRATLGLSAAVGPLVYVGPGAQIGARTVLHVGVHVEADAVVGDDCVLYNRVVVRHGCRIGARCIIQPGAVIGGDGFGFAPDPSPSGPVKIPHVGGVIIEDDVEIGANATVDRGTFDDTRIGRGTKIDNLVMVAHNVRVGPGCILVAQSGVAGSSRLNDGVILGAQSGVAGHLTVGDRATVYGQAGVMRDVAAGSRVAGTPAEPVKSFFRTISRLRKLDGWARRVRELEQAVKALITGHDQT